MTTSTEEDQQHCEIDPSQPVLTGIDWSAVR